MRPELDGMRLARRWCPDGQLGLRTLLDTPSTEPAPVAAIGVRFAPEAARSPRSAAARKCPVALVSIAGRNAAALPQCPNL